MKTKLYAATTLGVMLIAISGLILYQSNNKVDEPVKTYAMPVRTGDAEVNAGRSAPLGTSLHSDKGFLVDAKEHKPTERFVDEVATQMAKESVNNNPVVESQQDEIGEMEDLPADTDEPEFSMTLGELMESNGMTQSQMELMTSVLPFNPKVNIVSEEFIEMVDRLGEFIDRQMRESMKSLTLEEARLMVQFMKEDPTMTAEDYRAITQDYFPVHLKDALRKEGVLP